MKHFKASRNHKIFKELPVYRKHSQTFTEQSAHPKIITLKYAYSVAG